MGLLELMINAVEHDNLGISYTEKTDLILSNNWLREMESRLNHADFKGQKVAVHHRQASRLAGAFWRKS